MKSKQRGLWQRTLRTAAVMGTTVVVAATLNTTFPAMAAEPTPLVPDGSSPAAAAASCWEIKQVAPEGSSGRYWLLTPAMSAPDQFYCDQDTDGGGWALIGRGREGWKELYEGQGSTASVSEAVTGPEAFQPRQLSSTTVDGLLNNAAPEELDDGIRLRRATNSAGTAWQEARFNIQKRSRWTWAFSSETPVGGYRFDGTTGSGGTTSSFGRNQDLQRIVTSESAAQNWTQGWAFGSQARGSNSSGSYIWSTGPSTGNPRPFTQVYIRPKITQNNAGFDPLPDGGSTKSEQRSMQQTGAAPTVWGVNGLASGSGELNTEAQAFAQVGDTVFVGGNFRYVQRNSAGKDRVEQKYIAGFDVHTGELVSSFRPTFNGQVKELVALPNGQIVAGGDFTTVNGEPAVGVVALDPSAGTASTSWHVEIENRLSGQSVRVHGMSVEGGWLYLGGSFTHLTGGTSNNPVYARAAARVAISDGTPDRNWNPAFNGTAVDVEASEDGSRLYAAGYFTASNSIPTENAAAIRTAAGASVDTWNWTPSARTHFQFGVAEEGGRVWLGGSEHSLFSFAPQGFDQLSSNITRQGGDFQDVTGANNLIYAGCHCGHWNYTGGTQWPNIGPDWTIADKINLVGIWDAKTGEYLPSFNPVIKGRGGYGIWGNLVDSTGVLWTGGDLVSSVRGNGNSQWSGGFARFPLNDSTAPSTPAQVTATTDGQADILTWQAATGNPSEYQIMRNDRVIATTTGTTAEVPTAPDARYFVRSADVAGNRSASSRVVTPVATDPDPGHETTLIDQEKSWAYRYETQAPDAEWTEPSFNGNWPTGQAPLGWGSPAISTTLEAAGTKPLAAQFRKEFQISDASNIASVTLSTRADDGLVVYVNGAEVLRSNMPEGTITQNSYATAAPSTTSALASPATVTVPGWAFTTGTNVITAETHLNYRNTPNISFDLSAVAELGIQPDLPPDELPTPGEQQVVTEGSDWDYRFENSAPDEQWNSVSFDDAAWATGPAPLGWGSSEISTVLAAVGTKPLTSYMRHSFVLDDAEEVQELQLNTRADDGIALYVNGTEVLRNNLPTTALTFTDYATAAPSTSSALSNPLNVVVPGSLLRDGDNVIAAEVHSNWRTTPNTSFDVDAVAITQKEAQQKMMRKLDLSLPPAENDKDSRGKTRTPSPKESGKKLSSRSEIQETERGSGAQSNDADELTTPPSTAKLPSTSKPAADSSKSVDSKAANRQPTRKSPEVAESVPSTWSYVVLGNSTIPPTGWTTKSEAPSSWTAGQSTIAWGREATRKPETTLIPNETLALGTTLYARIKTSCSGDDPRGNGDHGKNMEVELPSLPNLHVFLDGEELILAKTTQRSTVDSGGNVKYVRASDQVVSRTKAGTERGQASDGPIDCSIVAVQFQVPGDGAGHAVLTSPSIIGPTTVSRTP